MIELILLFFVGIAGLLGFLVLMTIQKANKLRLYYEYEKSSTKHHYIRDYLVIPHVDKKTKNRFWKTVFWQPKLMVEEPLGEAVMVGEKGKLVAQMIVTGLNDNLVEGYWVRDKVIEKEVKLEKLTSTQREVIASQYRKAEETKPKETLLQTIVNIIPILVLAGVVIMGLIYAGDLMSSYNEVQNTHANMVKELNDASLRLNKICLDTGACTGGDAAQTFENVGRG